MVSMQSGQKYSCLWPGMHASLTIQPRLGEKKHLPGVGFEPTWTDAHWILSPTP